MILGEFCQLDFEVDCDAETTAALHTYFQVGDIGQTRVHGLGAVYQDALQGLKMCQANDVLDICEPLDRIYTASESVTRLEDSSLGRNISMEHRCHRDLVVWNPGLDGAYALGDLDANQYAKFLCVETASVNRPLASGLGVTFKI
jgi:glucose-6-phosphate 1-epimerase